MHAVGIKRVFWTDERGEWVGEKVDVLVRALEEGGDDVDDDSRRRKEGKEGVGEVGMGKAMGKGVFVTKHEVLMLRRMMMCP